MVKLLNPCRDKVRDNNWNSKWVKIQRKFELPIREDVGELIETRVTRLIRRNIRDVLIISRRNNKWQSS